MSKIEVTLIDVMIDRGRDVLTVAVPQHEIRVLQAVHGIDKVRPADKQEEDTELLDKSASAELSRMTRKYQRLNAPDPVRLAYPMGASQLSEFGFDPGIAGAPEQHAVIKKHKPAKKAAKSDK